MLRHNSNLSLGGGGGGGGCGQPTSKGGGGGNGTTTASSSSSSNPLRLFVDQTIFLDLSESCKQLAKVRECLTLIGARVADCLSKDVKYVITNRADKPLGPLADATNPASPSGLDSPHEPAKKLKTSPHALGFSSRGSFGRAQSVMEKASKAYKAIDVLTTAQRLGISVMSLADIERYVDKYIAKKKLLDEPDAGKTASTAAGVAAAGDAASNNSMNLVDQMAASSSKKRSQLLTKNDLDLSNHKIYKLKNPFLKFEPICKQYKPTYQEFKIWHDINFDAVSSKGTESPFQAYFSDDVKQEDGENSSSARGAGGDSNAESQSKAQLSRRPSQSMFKSPQSSNQSAALAQKTPVNNNNTLQSTGSTSNLFKTTASAAKTPAAAAAFAGLGGAGPGGRPLTSLPVKRKTTGYCECCKQRFDNLKQHLTSAQHENFERNQINFKEIDEYINGALNFKAFIDRRFPPDARLAVAAETSVSTEESSSDTARQQLPQQQQQQAASSSGLSLLRAGRTGGKPTPRASLNTNELPTTMDTSIINQEAILEAFNDFTYEIIETTAACK